MGLILEHDEPVFFFPVNGRFHVDGAGVDLFRFIQVLHEPLLFQIFCADGGHVHEADGLVPVTIDFFAHAQVFVEGLLDQTAVGAVLKGDFFDLRVEGGVPAVVGPVGVDDLQFCYCRIPVFLLEVFLHEGQVFVTHGKALGLAVEFELHVAHFPETVDHVHGFRRFQIHFQGGRLFFRSFLGVHRVDVIPFDLIHFRIGDGAGEDDDSGVFHGRFRGGVDEPDALGGGVCPLVILPRQVFHGEAFGAGRQVEGLVVDHVHRRFREDAEPGRLIGLLVDAFHIVAVQDPHGLQILQR